MKMRTAWSYCNLDVAAWASESETINKNLTSVHEAFFGFCLLIDHSIKYKLKLYIHLGYT